MTDSRAVGGLDRLPWLTDEPTRKPLAKRGSYNVLGLAGAAVLLVAGVSFWLGTRSETGGTPQNSAVAPTATVVVPQAQQIERQVQIAPQPQVAPPPSPQVQQAPAPQVRIPPQPPVRKIVVREIVRQVASEAPTEEQAPAAAAKEAVPATPAPQTHTAARQAQLIPWQPRVVTGAAGRLVEIGAFGSVPQAKSGWRYMVATYPAVAHLPAVVRPDRNSRGRLFYRFRVGTTSQAHSEVLCQRMQKIHLSCAVVGLPWKAKVER
jgi:outer membrane biosynthesis protein TonB